MGTRRILISDISSMRTQTRQTIHLDVVDDYAERMAEGDEFPPVDVWLNGDKPFYLSRGFHRVEAAKKCGFIEIDANVHEGNVHDAIMHGATDNITHGLRRSNEDKARAVKMFIEAMAAKHENLSDREIARRCGVAPTTVSAYRSSTVQIGQFPETRLGADGKTRKLPEPKPARLTEEPNMPVTDSDEAAGPARVNQEPAATRDLREARDARRAALQPDRSMCAVSDLQTLVDQGRRFGTIYADPPWAYGNQATRAATDNHYLTMSIEEIAALPVARLAGENAHLHLWTTNGFIFECRAIMEAWGFAYKSMMVWVKPQMGIGNYWRVSHEILLFGIRGAAPFGAHDEMSWVMADRTAHSAKPDVFRQKIEKVSPGPYLEMFARRTAPGWVSWGNEIERDMFNQDLEVLDGAVC